MQKIKEFSFTLLLGASIGIVLNVLGFIVLSFVIWEWIEIDWIFVRGVFIGAIILSLLIGLSTFIDEDNK